MEKIAVCILFLVAPLVAQRFVTSAPPAAATGPVFEASSRSRFSWYGVGSHFRVNGRANPFNCPSSVRAMFIRRPSPFGTGKPAWGSGLH